MLCRLNTLPVCEKLFFQSTAESADRKGPAVLDGCYWRHRGAATPRGRGRTAWILPSHGRRVCGRGELHGYRCAEAQSQYHCHCHWVPAWKRQAVWPLSAKMLPYSRRASESCRCSLGATRPHVGRTPNARIISTMFAAPIIEQAASSKDYLTHYGTPANFLAD